MDRRLTIAVLGAVLLGLGGCTSHNPRSVHDLDTGTPRAHTTRGQAIVGYTTAAGQYKRYEGFVRLLDDSLEFIPSESRHSRLQYPTPAERTRVARSEISTVDVKFRDVFRTALMVIGVTLAVGLVLVVIALATKESCPFIYSWDGSQYVFDGEPYGGATMKSLERTDWSELEHLAPDHGRYRLRLTNEVDETQHTNSLALLVVDHEPGTTVVMDKAGKPHAFRRLEPLSAARDENGRDLTVWLKETDRVSWYPDLEAYAGADSIADTRNHLTLRFNRPPGVQTAWLVSNAATGQWGSHLIRSMLGMRGDQVEAFYAAVNGSPLYHEQLLEWNRREELFELFLEVKKGDRWERGDFIPGSGPFISESRAIPLDLSGVEGDQVEIRIHPPIGFWNLNSFHLAWDEADSRVTELAAKSARGADGSDVAGTLSADDDRYVDFPTREQSAELVFGAPPRVRGMERAVFARTRGWYQVHLHGSGPPDLAAISRLTNEPGFVVRHGLREYSEFRRTGVLLGVPAPAGGLAR